MSENIIKQINQRRRLLLLGGLAGGAATLLQACGGSAGGTQEAFTGGDQFLATAVTTPSPVPANQVNLADYGGVPGAAASTIINAFNQAFTALKNLGGGTLNVAAGTYHLGNRSGNVNVINVYGLQNVLISASGAKFTMTTTDVSTPVFFNFDNPSNITIDGMSFTDYGTDLGVNWKGAVCFSVSTSATCSNFKTVNCVADNVVTFVRSYGDYTFTGFDINGTVTNAYYGINPNWNGRFSRCNLVCHNVRRAFIAFGARDWDITITGSADANGWGSNAYVSLTPDDWSPVENITARLIMSGELGNYNGGLMHVYHQGGNIAQYSSNIKSHIDITSYTSVPYAMFLFDHYDHSISDVRTSTLRTYNLCECTGSVPAGFPAANIIRNPSVSTGSPNSIKVQASLNPNLSGMPGYITTFTPASTSTTPTTTTPTTDTTTPTTDTTTPTTDTTTPTTDTDTTRKPKRGRWWR